MQAADSEKQNIGAATANTTGDVPKEPEAQVKPGSNFKFTPITFDKPADGDKAGAAAAKTEAEKRMERAKRFGVPVKDDVKKELRAQKFGIAKSEPTAKPAAKPIAKPAAKPIAKPAAKPSQVSQQMNYLDLWIWTLKN
jgi:hypothetical protein